MLQPDRRMTVKASQPMGRSIPAVPSLRAWIPALVCIAVACGVFGAVFQREFVSAVKVWRDSTTYNHCFLVLPLVAALLWQRADAISLLRPQPTPWVLAVVPAASALWAVAALLDILEAEQLVVVVLFELLLLAVLGWRVFYALLA